MGTSDELSPSNLKVVILLIILLGLIVLLILLYKKLNREANGEYTIRRMVYKEGGIRDRVRVTAYTLGTRLGVRLWRGSETDQDGEEMQEVQEKDSWVEKGNSQGSESEGEDEEEENEDDGDAEQCGETKGEGEDISDTKSGLGCLDAQEQTSVTEHPEGKEEKEEKWEKKEEKEGKAEGKGAGLLVDLKHFSGSALWSEEEAREGLDRDITAL